VHKLEKLAMNQLKWKGSAVLFLLTLLVASSFMALPAVRAEPRLDVSSDSQILVAGTVNSIVITVANSGDSTANDLNVTVTVPANNMLLIDSDGNYDFLNLPMGASVDIALQAYIVPSAAGSLIQITVRLDYRTTVSQYETKTLGFSVAAEDLNGSYLVPYFTDYDLQASQNNTVYLVVENQGGRTATNISVSLGTPSGLGSGAGGLQSLTSLTGTSSLASGSSQFLLYNNTGRWNFETLPSNDCLILPLTIFVMPSAAGSIAMFPVVLTYTDGYTYTQATRYAAVRVPSVPSTGISFHVSITPQDLYSGEITNAVMNVTNMGPAEADAITVQLSMSGSSGSSISDLLSGGGYSVPSVSSSPFVLMGQDGSWYLGTVAAGETRSLPIDIYTSSSAAGSVSSVSVSISYTDQMEESKKETKTIGLVIRGFVDIYVLDTSTFPQTITVGKSFSASVNIINLGTSIAEGVIVYPVGNDVLASTSANRIFLGDVEANIPTSLTISYMPGNVTNGTYTLNIPFSYKDSLGGTANGTLTVPLKLTVVNASASQSSENGSGGLWDFVAAYWWALVLLVAVAIFLAYYAVRRRKTRT